MAQGTQRVRVEVRWVERGGQLGEGAREVWVKVPGVLREGAAVRTQQAGGLGVAGGTWGDDIGNKSGWPTAHWGLACTRVDLPSVLPLGLSRLSSTSPLQLSILLPIPLTCLPPNPCQVASSLPCKLLSSSISALIGFVRCSNYVSQVGFQLVICLPQPPECWVCVVQLDTDLDLPVPGAPCLWIAGVCTTPSCFCVGNLRLCASSELHCHSLLWPLNTCNLTETPQTPQPGHPSVLSPAVLSFHVSRFPPPTPGPYQNPGTGRDHPNVVYQSLGRIGVSDPLALLGVG